MVLYDERSKQISLSRIAEHDEPEVLSECPYCHQPLRNVDGQAADEACTSPSLEQSFVNPDYFRLLHNSNNGSQSSTSPPSPRARPLQPLLPDNIRIQSASTSDTEDEGSSLPKHSPTPKHISAAAFSQNYFDKFFHIEEELGKGGRGVVYLVEHVLDGVSLGRFACKRVPCGNDRAWLEKVLTEVQLLQTLSHHNLVSYRHAWLEDCQLSSFGPSIPCAFILQQYCNAGDLHHYILGPKQTTMTKDQLKDRVRTRSKGQLDPMEPLSPRRLSFDEIFSIFKDITSGLHHLHINGYIHRDLKPRNCLLHRTGQRVRVLVSDFGEMQSATVQRTSTGYTGTISYCAPEIVRRDTHNGQLGNFTQKSDVFSLGAIVYFICFGRGPFQNADDDDEDNEDIELLREEISQWSGLHEERKDRMDLPEELYAFLQLLLSVDPAKRPTTEEILKSIKIGSPNSETTNFDTAPRVTSPRRGSVVGSNGVSDFSRPASSDAGSKGHKGVEVDLAAKPLIRRSRTLSPKVVNRSEMIVRPSKTQYVTNEVVKQGPLLLPAPKPRRARLLKRTIAGKLDIELALKLGLFCMKIWSASRACFPFAARPLALLAISGLAAIDIAGLSGGLSGTVVLALAHIAVLGLLQSYRLLCTVGPLLSDGGARRQDNAFMK